MRKNVLKIWDSPSNGAAAALVILAVVFFVGGLAGCTFAGRTDYGEETALSGYLDGYFGVAASEEVVRPDFFFLLWKTVRWPLLAVFLGLTPIGLIGVPVLFLVRAFLLSFSIASFFCVMGLDGLYFAFFVLGISGLIYIPILYVLGIQSFLNAGAIVGRITGENKRYVGFVRSDVFRCCICFIFLIVCSLVEYLAGPSIFKFAAEILNY